MFEYEIYNRSPVRIYDNHLHLAASGVITGYNAKKSYLMVGEKLVFPVESVSKIEVISYPEDERHHKKAREIPNLS